MSAPTTHDPLVVNTKDGMSWVRRAVTQDGRGLYALAGVCDCPEYLMASLAELAEHGIRGQADVLPVPVGPEAEAYVAPSPSCTRCYGADAVRFVANGGATAPCRACGPTEAETLRARVAELLAERHSTNEALSDAAEELRAKRDRIAELEADNAALQKDKEHVAAAAEPRLSTAEVAGWLRKKAAEYPTALERQESAPEAIARLASKVVRGAIRANNTAGVPPLTVFRASNDWIVMGLYTTAAEARKHCETELRREWPDGSLDWIKDEEDGVAELVAKTAGGETATGYVVTPLEVASRFDEEADE